MGTECHLFIFKGAFNPFGCLQPPQLGLKTNPPPIQEKPQKTTKKPPPAKEELLKMTVCTTQHFVNESHSLKLLSELFHKFICVTWQETVVTAFLSSKNMYDAVNGVREMKAPKHFLPEMLSKMIMCSLESPDEDREHVSTLINTLRMEGLVTGENFMQVCVYTMKFTLPAS